MIERNRQQSRRSSWVAMIAALSIWTWLVPAAAMDVPELRFNPFKKDSPVDVARPPGSAVRVGDRTFRPVLLSTVTAKEGGLANLGGEILSVGEEFNGYRLVRVSAFNATFEHNGKQVELEVTAEGGL